MWNPLRKDSTFAGGGAPPPHAPPSGQLASPGHASHHPWQFPSGGRGGAEPPHQRRTCMAWAMPYVWAAHALYVYMRTRSHILAMARAMPWLRPAKAQGTPSTVPACCHPSTAVRLPHHPQSLLLPLLPLKSPTNPPVYAVSALCSEQF